MTGSYEPFDNFAMEYDFQATLLNKNDFFISNLSTYKGAALDVGCGCGILSQELAKHYQTVIGIDISPQMLAIAQAKRGAINIHYIQMDASRLVLERKFDLITSKATLHHLPTLTPTLEALKNLLNPQGRIVLLDNVSEVETPATIGYIIGAVKDFLPDCFKFGFANAGRLFKFRTSSPWLKHLASDKYLSQEKFKNIYGSIFPGCSFTKLGCFMGMIWQRCN